MAIDEEHQLMILLGEYGSGKTSFSRHLTYTLLKEYHGRAVDARIPILINLREYRRSFSIQQVVTDVLVNQYGVQLGSFAAFERVCSTGRVVLVLDGFDEMLSSVEDRLVLEAFAQILILAALDVKTLLTCRTNMFASHRALIRVLQASSVQTAETALGRILKADLERYATILELVAWDEQRISEFVTKRTGTEAPNILSAIRSVHDLSDLSSRPVLLDMVVKTIPKLQSSAKPVNSAALYDAYTAMWTARDDWRVRTDADTRKAVCEALAVSMHKAGISSITHDRLHAIVADASRSAGTALSTSVDQFEADIQVCSFLVRSSSGEFRFAHKSFSEFFIATRAVEVLLNGEMDEPVVLAFPVTPALPDLAGLESILAAYRYSSVFDFDLEIRQLSNFHRLSSGWSEVFSGGREVAAPTRGRNEPRPTRDIRSAIEAQVRHSHPAAWAQREASLVTSQEIATFALELLVVRSVSLSSVIEACSANDSWNLFVDMLRLASVTDFVRINAADLRTEISNQDNNEVVAAIASALARARLLDALTLSALRTRLPAPWWHFCLFEVADSGDPDIDLDVFVDRLPDAALLERVIAIWGASLRDDGQVPVQLGLRGLLRDELASGDRDEQELAINLMAGLRFATDLEAIEFYQEVQRLDLPERTRLVAVSALEQLQDVRSVKLVRALRAQEKATRVRNAMQLIEQQINELHRPRRTGTHGGDSRKAVRESLWARLR